jgi:hypothetical protein
MKENNNDQSLTNKQVLHKKLDAAGWGLFFIWIGIALIAHIGWGAGLLGVGIITLGAQAARKYFDLKLEGFWVVVGFLFVVSGICNLFNVHLGFVLILCVVVGITLLVSALGGGRGIDRLGRIGRI